MGQGLPEWFLQVMGEIDALDLFPVYRAARCPLLVVSGDAMAFAGMFPKHLAPAWNAYCVWTQRQLEAVTRESPLVREASLPTGHDPHLEDPETLLRLLVEHLSRSDQEERSG
jgi:pimeloyl-ACP methyl ester carboxylesterase